MVRPIGLDSCRDEVTLTGVSRRVRRGGVIPEPDGHIDLRLLNRLELYGHKSQKERENRADEREPNEGEKETKTYDESRLVAVRAVKTDTGRQLRHQLNIGDNILCPTKKKAHQYTVPQPLNRSSTPKQKRKAPPTQTVPTIRQLAPLGRIRNPIKTLLQRIVLRELARIVRVRVRRRAARGGRGRGFVLVRDGDADADADTDEGEESDYGACDLWFVVAGTWI